MIGPALEFPRKVGWLEWAGEAGDGYENDAHHSSYSVIAIVMI